MFDQRLVRLNHRIKSYDSALYAKRAFRDIICVYRKSYRSYLAYHDEDFKLYDLMLSPQFVFALTDNWKTSGAPRDWGSEVILNRLRLMDAWEDQKILEKMDKENEKLQESRKRDFRNKTEDFLYEKHSQIKKSWNEVNTSTLGKDDPRKRKRDKKMKGI